MEISKPNGHATDRNILEKQKDMVPSQGMMQKGRHVQQQQTAIPAISQIAVASSASRQAILKHTVAASAGKSEMPETTIQHESKPTRAFQHAVNQYADSLLNLTTQERDGPGVFKFCLGITKKIHQLLYRKSLDPKNCYCIDYIKTHIGPFYATCLAPALRFLQMQTDNKCSWEYYHELSRLTHAFRFYPAHPDKAAVKAKLAELHQQFVNNELDYLDYVKDSLLPYPFTNSIHIIKWLLSEKSPAYKLEILPKECITELYEQINKLEKSRDALLQANNENTDKIEEELDELKEKTHHETTDRHILRKYHDAFMGRIETTLREWIQDKDNPDHQQLVVYIQKVHNHCAEFPDTLKEFGKLYDTLKGLSSCVVKTILVIIKNGTGNVDQLKEKTLQSINFLNEQGWLLHECKVLYTYANNMQPQTAVPTGKITELQCHQQLMEIESLTASKSRENHLIAANKLGVFLNKNNEDIKLLTTANSLFHRIHRITVKLHTALFLPFFQELDNYRSRDISYSIIHNLMAHHRSTLTQLQPFIFLIPNTPRARNGWETEACIIWHNYISSLYGKTSFNNDDVDGLVDLRNITLNVPFNNTRSRLKNVLSNILQFVQKNSGVISAEKVQILSEWYNYLASQHHNAHCHDADNNFNHGVVNLEKPDKEWESKHDNTTSEGTITPSADTPEKITPTSIHSGLHVASRFPEFPGYPSDAKQQVTHPPVMQPLTAPHQVPISADQWSYQQPGAVPYCLPMTQAPAATGPNPAPIQQPLPTTHYYMPTFADQWSYQQPEAVPYCLPMTQAPTATGPNPAPIQQPLPAAPHHMPTFADQWSYQQPEAVPYCLPMTQAPAATGPNPAPIQQPLPTTHYYMPTFADQWSYQQPEAVPYCLPMTQAPTATGPNPAPIQQPLPTAPDTSMDDQHHPTMPAVMFHFPVYAHAQACPACQRQLLPAGGPVQSQWPAMQQQHSFQPAMSSEFKPGCAFIGGVQQLPGELAEPTGQAMNYGQQLPIQGEGHQQ